MPTVPLRTSLLAFCLTTASVAAPAGELGQFDFWSAQSFEVNGELVCSMWSQPQVDEGKYTRRGDIFVWITHRPKRGTTNRVSFEMGYPVKAGLELKVKVDAETYELFTADSTAWNLEKVTDGKMVRAMRAGKEMEVKGVSKRGTTTRDVYSLKGFTAALKAIGKACKVKS